VILYHSNLVTQETMNSSFQLNQGESNSYKNKIEYSFKRSTYSSGMSIIDRQKNMPSDYSDDGYFSQDEDRYDEECYSEDEECDYEADDYDAIFKKTEEDKIAESNENYYDTMPKLQHPDKMEKILPARILPSVEEQEREYSEWIAFELLKCRQLKAVPIIERFFSYCLSTKVARAMLNHKHHRHQQLNEWKKLFCTPRTTRGVQRLDPLPPFEEEYLKYSIFAIEDEKKKKSEQAIIDEDKAKALWKKRVLEQKKSQRVNGKKRFLAKQGMNKNTAWHRARNSNSLVVKDKSTVTTSEEGKGRRAQRKINQEKKRKEAIEYEQRLNLNAPSIPEQTEESMPDIEISEEDEEAEIALALSLINKQCKNKIDVCLEEQKYQACEKKKADKKERDSWTTIKIKKTKKVMSLDEFSNPNGLIKQSTAKRISNDAKYSTRCDAFEVLGDKEKLGEALKFTQMCRSVIQGKKCYHTNCRFAHSVDQLTKRNCRFGLQCKFVRHVGQGRYISHKFGRTGKSCACYHPNETDQSFCLRLNLKYTPKPVTPKPVTPKPVTPKPVTPKPVTFKPVTFKQITSVSAWASLLSNTEAKVKYIEAKAKMTRSWASVVSSPKPSPKSEPVTPKNIITIIKPKFVCIKPAPAPVTTTPITSTFVTLPSVPAPAPVTTTPITSTFVTLPSVPVTAPVTTTSTPSSSSDKVREVVEKINKRISIAKAVEKAKAKAVEINMSLSRNRSRAEDWTPVQSKKHNTKKSKPNKSKTTVFKVRKENAEMAMLSIIRSGIKDFKIEIIDS